MAVCGDVIDVSKVGADEQACGEAGGAARSTASAATGRTLSARGMSWISTLTLSVPLKSLKVAKRRLDIHVMDEKTAIPADSFVLGSTGVTRELPTSPIPRPPALKKETPAWVRPAVGVLAFLVGAAGGFLGWKILFGGFAFPDQINGAERVESEMIDEAEQMVQGLVATMGVEVDVEYAFYGDGGGKPDYMMFSMGMEDGVLDMMAASSGATGDLNSMPSECSPVDPGSMCLWVHDDAVVALASFTQGVDVLSPTADQVKLEID